MTVYLVAQLRMRDRESYNRYQSRFMPVFQQFRGKLMVADEKPTVLKGEWQPDKVVIMSFPDEESFRAWHDSAAYQEIAKDRRAGAETSVFLVSAVVS